MRLSNLYIQNTTYNDKLLLECNSVPPSYLVIEAAIETGVLNEEDLNVLAQLLKAGLSKIQAALSPSSPDDLEMLLSFVAPHSGGARTINKLVETAKNQENSVMDDTVWLNELFKAFGASKETQDKVITKLKQEHDHSKSVSAKLNQFGKKAPQQPKPQRARSGRPQTEQPTPSRATTQPTSPQPQPNENEGELETLMRKFRTNKETAIENLRQLEAQLSAKNNG